MDKKIPAPPGSIPKPPKNYNIPKSPIISLEKGLIPPQAVDLEQVILGAMMIDKKGVEEVINILFYDVFYKEHHKFIFKAIRELYDKNIGIDLLTVSEELKRVNKLNDIGGDFYLISLTQRVSSSAHIEFHSRIVLQKYILRRLIANAMYVQDLCFRSDPDVFHLMDSVSENINEIHRVAVIQNGQSGETNAAEELRKKVVEVATGNSPGVPIGISEFDEWSGGIQDRELITLAARTGMGKTTAILAIAGNIAIDKEIPIAIFSLEMSKIDLIYRLASRLTSVPYGRIRKAELSQEELEKVTSAIKYLESSKLQIYDTTYHKNNHETICKKIRELAAAGVKKIVIDYVQLMKLTNSTSDRTGDLSKITRELKGLTNELNVPIMILAQVNRSTDSRHGSKVPFLSDLKQSGSIEEDSDMVIFLVRDAYYRQEENSSIELPPQIVGDTRFIIAKGRGTGTKSFRVFIDFFKYNICSYTDSDY